MKKDNALSWTTFLFVIVFYIAASSVAWAAPAKKVPDGLTPCFNYLNELVSHGCRGEFEVAKVGPLLAFAGGNHDTNQLWEGGERPEGTMGYYDFTVNASLEKVLKYCFNPAIPSCAVIPDVVRLSSLSNTKGCEAVSPPLLWKRIDALEKPLIVGDVIYMQNTPDTNTGAYYGYDSDRIEILFREGERRVLLSVTRQNGVSEVGKKGYFFGDGDSREYFYSGESGLTKMGLGWVKSYIYDSFSVSVYMDEGPGAGQVKCATFKWLNAGWKGRNMVKASHIRKGLAAYARALRAFIESENLPDHEEIARVCSTLYSLPEEEMRALLEEHYNHVKVKNPTFGGKKIRKRFFENKGYLEGLTREEMGADLIRAYVKGIINGYEEYHLTLQVEKAGGSVLKM